MGILWQACTFVDVHSIKSGFVKQFLLTIYRDEIIMPWPIKVAVTWLNARSGKLITFQMPKVVQVKSASQECASCMLALLAALFWQLMLCSSNNINDGVVIDISNSKYSDNRKKRNLKGV